MVLGAGRGPLVTSCVVQTKAVGVLSKIYAVEKNPNAILTYVELHSFCGVFFFLDSQF